MKEHWGRFGRHYYMRYDYEEVETDKANAVMDRLKGKFEEFKEGTVDNFEYTDPIDGSVTKNQGLRFITPEWRVIYRLSGTGSVGATIRVYYEKYERERIDLDAKEALSSVIQWSLEFSDINAITGREAPTVIT